MTVAAVPNHLDQAPDVSARFAKLKQRPVILDVRNPPEFQICRIPGSTLLPLPELAQRVGELDPNREMVVHCKSGYRSSIATSLLRRAGCQDVANLTGGYDAWRSTQPGAAGGAG